MKPFRNPSRTLQVAARARARAWGVGSGFGGGCTAPPRPAHAQLLTGRAGAGGEVGAGADDVHLPGEAQVRAALVVRAAGRGADAALPGLGHGLQVLHLVHHGLHRHPRPPRALLGALQRALAEVRPVDVVLELRQETGRIAPPRE